MSQKLNANAKEWRPAGELAAFRLPASTSEKDGDSVVGNSAAADVVADDNNGGTVPPLLPQNQQEKQEQQEQQRNMRTLDAVTESPVYYPSFTRAGPSAVLAGGVAVELEGVNWAEEFERVMALTKELIKRQMHSEQEAASARLEGGHVGHPKPVRNPSVDRTSPQKSQSVVRATDANRFPALPGADEVRPLVSGKWVNAARVLLPPSNASGGGEGHAYTTSTSTTTAAPTHPPAPASAVTELDENGRPLPPLTAKGNRRWKKPTKAQQKREMAQKNAFEAFANALLHSISPFMLPLRERCKTSLPHIKVDQRFGKSGQPQTAVAQFVVAPLVTNYRPRHFHDLTPGDLMEFHYDFAQVLKQLKSASDILFGYGPVWKRYAVPYCYVSCKEYRQEVLNLCPDEVPNMRMEAIYEDDIVKDITDVVLAVEELEPLQSMSIAQAMSRRVNLAPLFDAFDAIFKPIENYRIIIRDLHHAPSTYLIQASHHEIQQKPSPLVLYNDPNLWYELPVVSRIRVEEKTTDEAFEHPAANTPKTAVVSTKSAGGESKFGSTFRNDCSTSAEHGAQVKGSNPGQMYPLAVMAPVVGSVLCVLLTACIVWRRRSGQ
ncbi:putative transmembrane transport protein [Trypanosoma rangeli]|uniref:Putative transmembrane transport protein n=1 Tax=Trypanosoma rangeli TaxID=5698 RepID=A0A422NQN2_TRYRA|nr:putative transmembrane transport protein [Trypanosoma rangeli]RNF07820.1 putative transmembrane transport protein [Trypanosoma rangeli]|eukprot:RNF07820.1 putative transmembrane transport protein [Trypanosoma rangeli]